MILRATAAALMLALPVMAEAKPCGPVCERPIEGHHERHAENRHEPRIGDRGNRGHAFNDRQKYRLPAPPSRQEYRVIDDTVVRVDRDTQKIVAVVGLLSALSAH